MKSEALREKYLDRIARLLERLSNEDDHDEGESGETILDGNIEGAFMGTLTVMQDLYGADSLQVEELRNLKGRADRSGRRGYRNTYLARDLASTLVNLRQEIEAGLISSIAEQAAGEVFADFLVMAKSALDEGHVPVAAVLTAAALEDTMKRKAEELGLSVEDETLETVIRSLKGQSVFQGAAAKLVPSFVKFRNSAMHAKWDSIEAADVKSVVGYLEGFLIEHFS